MTHRCIFVLLVMLLIARSIPAHAQSPSVKATPETPVSFSLESEEAQAAERRIQAALAKEVSFDWKDIPLKDVISQLADAGGITIVLTKKVEDVGIKVDHPITRKVVKASLQSTLRLLLPDLQLTYLIKDNTIRITCIDSECPVQNMSIRLYPVRDLVDLANPAKDAKPTLNFEPLIALVQEIEPDSWQDVGGSGCVKGFENGGCLFVSQRDDIHERIGQLLVTLRRVKAAQGLKGTAGNAEVPNRDVMPATPIR